LSSSTYYTLTYLVIHSTYSTTTTSRKQSSIQGHTIMISSDTTGSLASVEHLDVFPNEALGPFKLGDSFWTVTEVLKNYRSTFRVVDISWDEKVSTSFLLSGLQICAARCAERPVPSVTLIRTPHRARSCSNSTVTSPSSSHPLHLRVLNCSNGSISTSPSHPLQNPLPHQ
jgi:hypothetical protein